MKKFIPLLFVLILFQNSFGQQASDYFPNQMGYKWYFKVTPLDSLNNQVDSLKTYRIDSLAFENIFSGLNAKHILSKSGTVNTVNIAPYSDTAYVNLSSSVGKTYFQTNISDSLVRVFDSLGYGNLITTVKSFEKWYDTYKFQQSANLSYTIFQYDTTVIIDTITIPLRVQLTGKRLNDASLSTEIGTFTCKKFLHTLMVGYRLTSFLVIPFFNTYDTTYFAQNKWIIKSVIPSTIIDLSLLSLGKYWFPGETIEVINPITNTNDKMMTVDEFSLEQNYPNPFNPKTQIKYSIGKEQFVTLKVFDLLGKEVATLVNEKKNAGTYVIEFDANKFSSGIYFYKLSSNSNNIIKKMVILK